MPFWDFRNDLTQTFDLKNHTTNEYQKHQLYVRTANH